MKFSKGEKSRTYARLLSIHFFPCHSCSINCGDKICRVFFSFSFFPCQHGFILFPFSRGLLVMHLKNNFFWSKKRRKKCTYGEYNKKQKLIQKIESQEKRNMKNSCKSLFFLFSAKLYWSSKIRNK